MINEIIPSEPVKKKGKHYPFTTCCNQLYMALLLSNPGDHKFEPPVTQISALQSYYRSQEAIFSEIPLWVAIIMQRRTKLLIARYQLFTVSYSERAADFMDIPSFWSKCLQ